jgi:hypothetical protein
MVKEKKIPRNFLFKGKKVSRSARGSLPSPAMHHFPAN